MTAEGKLSPGKKKLVSATALGFNEKKLKELIKSKDLDGIYVLAYKRQLLALAWHFATKNFE